MQVKTSSTRRKSKRKEKNDWRDVIANTVDISTNTKKSPEVACQQKPSKKHMRHIQKL